jgi:tRNA modification GTPase
MHYPALSDTIVAVSTGWEAAAVGVVRVSGASPDDVLAAVGVSRPADPPAPRHFSTRLQLAPDLSVPADVLWFAAPRSYTGQDVIELHLPGGLPLLRAVCDALIGAGARRALPGEFSARAFLNGKLDAGQITSVLELLHAGRHQDVRHAARALRSTAAARAEAWVDRLTDLLTRIEAGIDFVEEEDIRFVTPDEVRATLDALRAALPSQEDGAPDTRRATRPHVALAGPPNAGKSTLFNALLGTQRAIVSPVLGTTRDVLSAEITLRNTTVVLQDCAGLGPTRGELELAAHLASEQAADLADLVVWVHPLEAAWSGAEQAACARVPATRRALVWSKADRGAPVADAAMSAAPLEFLWTTRVSAVAGTGLDDLRDRLAHTVSELPPTSADAGTTSAAGVGAALDRARRLAQDEPLPLDLLALELRTGLELASDGEAGPVDERILSRIYAEFCVGK